MKYSSDRLGTAWSLQCVVYNVILGRCCSGTYTSIHINNRCTRSSWQHFLPCKHRFYVKNVHLAASPLTDDHYRRISSYQGNAGAEEKSEAISAVDDKFAGRQQQLEMQIIQVST